MINCFKKDYISWVSITAKIISRWYHMKWFKIIKKIVQIIVGWSDACTFYKKGEIISYNWKEVKSGKYGVGGAYSLLYLGISII